MASEMTVPASQPVEAKPDRLVSMDVLRGLMMVLAASELLQTHQWVPKAFPDSAFWQYFQFHMVHVAWQGCSLHDLIMPIFAFLVGTSCAYSIASRQARGSSNWMIVRHSVWRAAVLVALGVWLASINRPAPNWSFANVLAQIGLGYFPLVCIALKFKLKGTAIIVACLLAAYWLLFACWPLPKGSTAFTDHWIHASHPVKSFDLWILPYFPGNGKVVFSGFGILDAVPTLGTMLIGLIAGYILKSLSHNSRKLLFTLVGVGIVMLFLGWLMEFAGICPIIKKIWTPSFVLWSGGWAFFGLALFYYLCDILKWRRIFFPLQIVGMNSIAAYVLIDFQWGCAFIKAAISPIFQPIRWTVDTLMQHTVTIPTPTSKILAENIPNFILKCFALLAIWLILFWMHKRKLYLKL